MEYAWLRFLAKASIYGSISIHYVKRGVQHTCSSAQHTGPVLHLGPHKSTSFSLTAGSGSSARPLSTQGVGPENQPPDSQVFRIEHRPASCLGVNASPDTEVAVSNPTMAERQSRPIVACMERAGKRRNAVLVQRRLMES